MTFADVNPAVFPEVKVADYKGRGAWTKAGIGFDYRYSLAPAGSERIGKHPELDLHHWATAAGCYAIQRRLMSLGHLAKDYPADRYGIFNTTTKRAVMAFQVANKDPFSDTQLAIDGIVGTTDAAALFTPLIDAAEKAHGIPGHLLRGETRHESLLDPGAVGYYCWYLDTNGVWDFRGVDRGASQINAVANPQVSWRDAFDFEFAVNWSGDRLRAKYNAFLVKYPEQDHDTLWDAAILNHNNPSAANDWARYGGPVSVAAAKYVSDAHAAIY